MTVEDMADRPSRPTAPPALPRLLGWGMWGVLAVFSLLAIGSPLVGQQVFLATEILGDRAPWQAVLEDAEPAPNIFVGDTINAMAPQTIRIVESVRSGDLPEWTPLGQGGFELAGLPNSGAYSPLSLPWWLLPFSLAPAWVKVLEIVTVTVGMSLFLRRLGLPQPVWPVASMIYLSSGFMVAWTNWPQTRVAAFVPLLFFAVDRVIGQPRIAAAVPLGLVLAAMVLGGFPAVTIYAVYAVAAWGLFRAVQVHRRRFGDMGRALLVCVLGGALGLLLSAWQAVPFVINSASIINFEARNTTGNHLPVEALASMIYPSIAGGVRHGAWLQHPVAVLSYVGMVTFLLIAILPLARARFPGQTAILLFFGTGTAVLVAAIFFGGPALTALQMLPTIASSFIGRMNVIVGFFAAVMAAYGLGLLLQGRRAFAILGDGTSAVGAALRLLGATAIAAAGAVVCVNAWRAVPLGAQSALLREIAVITVIGLVVALAILLVVLTPGALVGWLAAGLAAVGLLIPSVGLARTWWPPSSEETFYPTTQTHAFLAARLGDQRFVTVGSAMLPGTNQVYGLASLGGRGFATTQWRDLLRAVDPGYFQSSTYARLTPQVAPATGRDPILDRFGVRYLVQSNLELPYGSPPAQLEPAAGVNLAPEETALTASGTGPLRGVLLRVVSADPVADLVISARLVGEAGEELATTGTFLRAAQADVPLALAADGLAAGQPWQLQVQARAAGPVPLQTTGDGSLWAAVVRPLDDGFRVVATGEATVYERSNPNATVRWAGSAVLEADPQQRVALLQEGRIPQDVVLLERPEDLPGPRPTANGSVTPLPSDDVDRRRFAVTAGAAGWIVVDDSLRRPGWSAAVDGEPAEFVPADHAGRAVPVPAGEHVVELRYRTPGLREGAAVSAATLAALAIAFAVRHRRRGS